MVAYMEEAVEHIEIMVVMEELMEEAAEQVIIHLAEKVSVVHMEEMVDG